MRAVLILIGFLVLTYAPLEGQAHYTVRVDDPATRTLHIVAELPATGESTVVSLRTRERTDIIIEPDPGADERAQRLREEMLAR